MDLVDPWTLLKQLLVFAQLVAAVAFVAVAAAVEPQLCCRGAMAIAPSMVLDQHCCIHHHHEPTCCIKIKWWR